MSRTSTDYYRATMRFRWSDGGGGLGTGMAKLKVYLCLERNDADYRTASADYAEAANFAFQQNADGGLPVFR
ncbi:hypothetical protein [Streptomyces sp. NPDC012510]|uniref:hypothetical protein n=1 Tax=Streptomyces sp. NPDC012510 TaxID=3364838 RepID=UPI0036E12405